MEAIVGEDIVIRDFTPEAERFFRNLLTFDNPEYFKKLNSGKWTGNTPQKITLLQRNGKNLVVPFGVLPEVFNKKKAFDGIYHNFNLGISDCDYKSSIKPYDYQEEAIQKALDSRQGIIVAPCGSGKTQIGLEIAARLRKKTLWLTHTSDLLNQSLERARSCFGLMNGDYGTITAGKINIGNVITFATVQTMNKIDLLKVKDAWDVVIVDECHHAVGTPTQVMMFYHVISSLKARWKYGLTATPKRADGLSPCMFYLIGPKICEIERSAVEETTCPVKVIVRKTFYMPDTSKILMPDGTISYPRFITDVISNRERNEMIAEDIEKAAGTCLVLTERVQHVDVLKKKLEERGVSAISLTAASSKKAKEEREQAIYAMNNRCVKVLLATFALAKEGLDVPSLDNLFMATPQKNETVVTQSAGRVARKADGKDHGTVYDYEDSFGMLVSWQKKRSRIYKGLGFDVKDE